MSNTLQQELISLCITAYQDTLLKESGAKDETEAKVDAQQILLDRSN